MAQKINVTLVDDIDGGEAAETVEFALDGTRYEIDLSAQNAQGLRDALAQYVAAARRAGRGAGAPSSSSNGRRSRRGSTSMDRSQVQHVRQWARDNGLKVSERGRISADILEKYQAAH
ncbi:MAG TPA: Lsr2 family protein [Mycobacteriales bacterium]|nr:Lsr2 family protein [Mycobacteriales bacterium]